MFRVTSLLFVIQNLLEVYAYGSIALKLWSILPLSFDHRYSSFVYIYCIGVISLLLNGNYSVKALLVLSHRLFCIYLELAVFVQYMMFI